jgi:hypothetical protein
LTQLPPTFRGAVRLYNATGQLLQQIDANNNAGAGVKDLGTLPIVFTLQSATFPKVGDMFTKQVVESQIELAATAGQVSYTIQAQNDQGKVIGLTTIVAAGPGSLWGSNNWLDGSLWTSAQAQAVPRTYPVPWTAPLVFEKMQLIISGTATAVPGIGTFYARYQKTGYMTTGIQ